MKAFLLFFLMIVGPSCSSILKMDHDRSPSQATAPTFDQDVAILKRSLIARTVVLDRDMLTFHYPEPDHADFHPTSQRDEYELLSKLAAEFWDAFSHEGENYDQGPGLYVAVDPYSSRSFGTTNPKLYGITIKKGARILLTTTSYAKGEKSVIESLYAKYHCQSGEAVTPERFPDIFGRLRRALAPECRQLAIQAAKEVGIEAIEYPYSGSSTLKGCRHKRAIALNIINGSAILEGGLYFYDDSSKLEGQPIASQLARLYEESSYAPDLQLSTDHQSPPRSLQGEVSDKSYSEFKNRYIYKCGQRWSLEVSDTLNDTIEKIYSVERNEEAVIASRKFRYAFVARFPSKILDLDRINFFEQKMFAADTGDNLSFQTWKSVKDKLDSTGTGHGGLVNAAKMMGERYPSADLDEYHSQIVYSYKKSKFPNLPAGYSKFGFGPRITRLQTNKAMINFGGVPYFHALPRDAIHDFSKVRAMDRNFYLQMLNKCAQEYAKENIRDQTIENGLCGLREKEN